MFGEENAAVLLFLQQEKVRYAKSYFPVLSLEKLLLGGREQIHISQVLRLDWEH